jgi:hypothetical protein
MGPYSLAAGEVLADGYYATAGVPPDFENLVVELEAPDGRLADLSREDNDPDVVVHWPTDPEWERARVGSLADAMRALQFAGDRLANPGQVQPTLSRLTGSDALVGGYYVLEKTDVESIVVEVHAPDGIVAFLSKGSRDRDVVVRWPVEEGVTRSPRGLFTDIMRALEYGKDRLLSLQGKAGL